MTEAGIDDRWNMDLFVALGEDLGAGRWSIRAQLRPLINYVWLAAGPHGAGRRDWRPVTVAIGRASDTAEPTQSGRGRRGNLNRFILPVVVFLALAGVLYVGVKHSPDKSTMVSALLGKPAPAFDLPVLGDASRKFSPAQLAGRPWVLNVWGTWCAECRVEHETLLEIARQNRVPLVGLNWQRRRRGGARMAGSSSAIPTPSSRWTATDARPSTSVCTARPRPSSSTPTGCVQYRHVGAMTPEVWEREFAVAPAAAGNAMSAVAA